MSAILTKIKEWKNVIYLLFFGSPVLFLAFVNNDSVSLLIVGFCLLFSDEQVTY